MSNAANFGHCGDAKVCNGLMVGGTLVLDSNKNLKGINSVKTNDLIVRGCVSTPVVLGEDVMFGNVLSVSTTEDRKVVNSSTDQDLLVVGVAGEAGSAGDTINMCVGGEFQVRKYGSVTRGELLTSYGSNYVGTAHTGMGSVPGNFAVAVGSANASVDFVWARFKKAETY